MKIDLEDLALCEAFHASNGLRAKIDQHIVGLPTDDLCRDILWQELELVVATLETLVRRLANTHASQLPVLRAKAVVLATVMLSGAEGASPFITDDEKTALALSLANDIIRVLGVGAGGDTEAEIVSVVKLKPPHDP